MTVDVRREMCLPICTPLCAIQEARHIHMQITCVIEGYYHMHSTLCIIHIQMARFELKIFLNSQR